MTVSRAQAGLPKLCNSGQSYLITNRDQPTAVLLPIGDYEALIETLDLLANTEAMKVLATAKAGGTAAGASIHALPRMAGGNGL